MEEEGKGDRVRGQRRQGWGGRRGGYMQGRGGGGYMQGRGGRGRGGGQTSAYTVSLTT